MSDWVWWLVPVALVAVWWWQGRPGWPPRREAERSSLLETVQDCRSAPALRLHGHIARAATHRDLWALRADAHDVIARHHCQSVAAQRILTLESLLEGRNL